MYLGMGYWSVASLYGMFSYAVIICTRGGFRVMVLNDTFNNILVI